MTAACRCFWTRIHYLGQQSFYSPTGTFPGAGSCFCTSSSPRAPPLQSFTKTGQSKGQNSAPLVAQMEVRPFLPQCCPCVWELLLCGSCLLQQQHKRQWESCAMKEKSRAMKEESRAIKKKSCAMKEKSCAMKSPIRLV